MNKTGIIKCGRNDQVSNFTRSLSQKILHCFFDFIHIVSYLLSSI